MLPDRTVRRVSALKLEGRLLGALLECLVNLGFSAGCRVDLLKLRDRKRCLLRILPCKIRIKIRKLRLSVLSLLDGKSHLKPPVTEMNVSDDLVAHKSSHTL